MSKALGRGLGALIPGFSDDTTFSSLDEILGETVTLKKMEITSKNDTSKVSKSDESNIKQVKIMSIEPCKGQPRTTFDEESLNELAASIKNYGIIQPLIVRPIANSRYEIIAGERRWRAAQIAELKEVPIVVRHNSEENLMELALVENLQRVDLNPIDEALGYKTLIDKYNLTQEEIAARLGKNRSTIANSMRLLKLPQSVKELVETGDISFGHARALAVINNEEKQKQVAEKIIRHDLSVRATEKLIKSLTSKKKISVNNEENSEIKIYLETLEKKLENKFGTKVKILSGKKKNKIEIEYYTNKDLSRILDSLYL